MNKWPKILPPLTEEQKAINDDFVRHWMTLFPKKFGVVGKFNHHYVVDRAPKSFLRTLEIGAGLGEHLEYEDLTPEQEVNYVALELRENMAERIRERYRVSKPTLGIVKPSWTSRTITSTAFWRFMFWNISQTCLKRLRKCIGFVTRQAEFFLL